MPERFFHSKLRLIASAVVAVGFLFQPIRASVQETEKEIEVRFVDSANQPVENVRAYRYQNGKAKVISCADGTGSIPANGGLVVARKDGFQFSGTVINPNDANATVVMMKDDEVGRKLATLPLPISDASKQKVIETLEEDFWTTLNANPKDFSNVATCMKVLSWLNPEKTLQYIESNPVRGQMDVMVKQEVIKVLGKTDFETAVELTNTVKDPMGRSMLLRVLLKNPGADSELLAAVETEMADTIKSIPQPMYRYAVWASLAEHYLDTSRPEMAQKITDQHIEDIKKLPAGGWSGFPRSLFAALIVERDPELAKELVKGMDKNESDRALGRLAFHCCRTHPQMAVEFLNQQKPSKNQIVRAKNHIQVCHRMAIEQTDAAFELAASIKEPNQQAWAYGLMAQRLHESDPDRANQALDLAVTCLANNTTQDQSRFSSASTSAGLLPIAEQVASEKMNSLIWKSVYLSLPRSRWNTGGGSKTLKMQTAAAAIARYDVVIARNPCW